MKNLLIRAGIAVLGVVITLTWWTIRKGDSHVQSVSKIPAKVWAGGHTLEVEAETSCAAKMSISFADISKPVGEQPQMQTLEKVSPGTYTWTIDVPAQVGGYIELDADAPQVGDTLKIKVKIDGKFIGEDSGKLEKPLEPRYTFGVQRYYDDYSKAASGESDAGSDDKQ